MISREQSLCSVPFIRHHVRAWISLLFILLFLPAVIQAQTSPLSVEVEAGPVWQSYNDAEIPNDGTATRFSLHDIQGNGPWFAGRITVEWTPAARHGLRLLLAPLELNETGTPADDITFREETFQAGEPLEATYRFNSYRLTYRYLLHDGARSHLWLGVTGKIRDAEVALEQEGRSRQKEDVGFVPLLYLAGDWTIAPGWHLNLEGDALASGYGRAVDAALKLGYDLSESWKIQAGYRILEGGSDVTETYTFAWLNYAAISLKWQLGR